MRATGLRAVPLYLLADVVSEREPRANGNWGERNPAGAEREQGEKTHASHSLTSARPNFRSLARYISATTHNCEDHTGTKNSFQSAFQVGSHVIIVAQRCLLLQ